MPGERAPSRIQTDHRPNGSTASIRAASCGVECRSIIMQDILWVGLFLVLMVASLGYAVLCDRA